MTIQRGDYVRPNHPGVGLPFDSVWYVSCANGQLTLEPENAVARSVSRRVTGCRFPAEAFDKVVRCSGQWVDVRDAELRFGYASVFDDDVLTGRMSSKPINWTPIQPKTMFSKARPDAVATATIAAEQAASAAAAMHRLLEDARKQERQRQEELRIATAAKAKADKEAAARAKREEAREALAAKLHADRCLAEAGLELIAEVSRLNNGGPEQVAHHSIASHAGQLQPLAKSYGYRIVKPSMLAQVVKL